MSRKINLLSAALLMVALSGCRSFSGTVRLVKNPDGRWEATEVTLPDDGVSPGELKAMEDMLNDE